MQGNEISAQRRIFLRVIAVAILAIGISGGLWRLGWNIPLPDTAPATFHGALLVAALFGLVIGIEGAAAYGRRSAYIGPFCAGIGGAATALGAPHLLSAALLLAGSTMLAAATFANYRHQHAPHHFMLPIGTLCGVVGSMLWLSGLPASQVVGAWTGFIVLTIGGARVEHAHLNRPSPPALKLQVALTAFYVAGGLVLPIHWRTGMTLLGLATVGLALWMFECDVARRNLRHRGQMRFGAVCLVGGYFWLAIGGLLLPFAAPAGYLYDAALHAVFLGFVLAMFMGKAFQHETETLGIAAPYTAFSYGYIALLNATLLLRIVGDLAQRSDWRAWGGMGNAAAIALFLATTSSGALFSRKRQAA